MKLIGLMPVRNEDWCLGLTARAALMWVDELVIGLHACTDRSETILYDIQLNEAKERLNYVDLPGDQWTEMSHRQMLLEAAREGGATHIAMIDADEILTGNLIGASILSLHNQIEHCGASHIFQIPLYNLRHGIQQYHSNGLWGSRIVSVAFADDPALHWAGDRFHHREPMGKRLTGFTPINQGDGGGVMHLWGASERRLLAKHAMYKVTERLRWPDKDVREIDRTYSMCVKGAVQQFRPFTIRESDLWNFNVVPSSWWEPYAHLMQYLDVDREPWQEAEVRRIVAEHGREKFSGLDLFGLA